MVLARRTLQLYISCTPTCHHTVPYAVCPTLARSACPPILRSFTTFVHSLRSLAPIPPRTLLQDCREAGFPDPALVYQGDTAYLTANDFDGIKLDNCGEFTNLTLWSDLINKTGKPQLIENCHWYVGKEIVEHTHI